MRDENRPINAVPESAVLNRTSSPTGQVITFGSNGEFSIAVRKQTTPTSCGQACLEMLGHPIEGTGLEDPGYEVSTLDLFIDFNGEETKTNLTVETTHMVAGQKKRTGCMHWYLRIGDIVINPETGTVEKAQDYEEREIAEIKAVIKVPFISENK